MITIGRHIPRYDFFSSQEAPYKSVAEAMQIMHSHLMPLREGTNTNDQFLYKEARESVGFLSDVLKIDREESLKPFLKEVSNWEFLSTLAGCWNDPSLGIRKASSYDLNCIVREQANLERVGIKALAKYEIISINQFRNQTHFSIYGFDFNKIQASLREVIAEQNNANLLL